jgi:hypothetical protein
MEVRISQAVAQKMMKGKPNIYGSTRLTTDNEPIAGMTLSSTMIFFK